MSTRASQRGATLLVSLIMLVALTLFAVTGISLSNVNLRIAGNAQQQRLLETSIQEAIEQVLSNVTLFAAGAVEQTATINGFDVTVTAPVCTFATVATGYSATSNISPELTHWEFVASVDDLLLGNKMTIHQGVRIPMTAGNCP